VGTNHWARLLRVG